jgi:hypothetical protein
MTGREVVNGAQLGAELAERRDAWHSRLTRPRPPRPRCGRPRTDGQPCRAISAAPPYLAGISSDYALVACSRHMTAAELAEYRQIAEAVSGELARREDVRRRAVPVACHSWPVTAEDAAAAFAVGAAVGADVRDRLGWELLVSWQAGRCAICGGRAAVLDHDHVTGSVRGWLCRSCNLREPGDYFPGGAGERYRARHPATILGVTLVYVHPLWGSAEPEAAAADLDGSPVYALAAYLAGGAG